MDYDDVGDGGGGTTAPRKTNSLLKNKTLRRAAIVLGVLALIVLGTLVVIGIYNVARSTPQEVLAQAHDEDISGPYPLRALIYDTRRGYFEDVAPDGQVRHIDPASEENVVATSKNNNADDSAKENENDNFSNKNKKAQVQYVILLHGLKSTAELWLPTIERWCARASHDVVFVLPDLLGHGKSPWPNKDKHDVARHIATLRVLLARVLPHTTDVPLHIAGHSLGAMLALELTASLLEYPLDSMSGPGDIKSLTLMSTPYYESEREARDAAHRHSFWFRHQTLSHLCCGSLFCRQSWLWQPALQRKFRAKYPKLPQSVYAAAWQHSEHGIHSSAEHAVIKHRAMQAARTVRDHGVSVLQIDGDKDDLCTTSRNTLARDLAPFCTSVLLHGGTHSFVAHRIDEVVEKFRSFVQAAADVK